MLTRLVRYVVTCLTAGATTPSHVAAVVSGWSDSRVSAFLHLARQRACWLVCAVARFCLDRMGAYDRVSWSVCLRHVSRWVGGVIFARRRPQKNVATRSLVCCRVALTVARINAEWSARLSAPWQVPEERSRCGLPCMCCFAWAPMSSSKASLQVHPVRGTVGEFTHPPRTTKFGRNHEVSQHQFKVLATCQQISAKMHR